MTPPAEEEAKIFNWIPAFAGMTISFISNQGLHRMGLSTFMTRLLRVPPQAKTSRAGPMIAWSQVGQPQWTPRRMGNLAEEGFRKNVIAYRCVMQIATAAAAIPLVLYDARGNEIDRHPVLDLLTHPNPLQDGVTFIESVYANLQIFGNAYIEAIRPRDNDAPVELYALRPDRMKVIPGPAGLPQGYQYNVNGQVTNWAADPINGDSNILHLKQFHPLDDWYGLAPMEAALQSIDQHNASGEWNQALLNQGARPSGALVYSPKDGGPATLSDDQLQRLREEMGQLYQGDRNAGRPLILEGGLDWREMSLSPKDMDWLSGRNNAARDIALAFGVPGQLIGLPDAQTYANFEQARLGFYEETVLPQITRVIAGLDHWLCPMYRDRPELDFDPDSISALTDKRQAQWNKIQNANFLTRNEKRQAAGYGPVPGGDADGDDDADPDGAKFNPNHDPDNGQFTSGDGGDNSDKDNDSDSADSLDKANDAPTAPTGNGFGPGIFGLPENVDEHATVPVGARGGPKIYSTPGGIGYDSGIAGDMSKRDWTSDQIDNAVQNGDRIDAINKETGGAATRYVDPGTGRSVVIDNSTNSVIQIGKPDFEYSVESGDVPGAGMRPPSFSPGGGGGGFSPINPKLPGEPEEVL